MANLVSYGEDAAELLWIMSFKDPVSVAQEQKQPLVKDLHQVLGEVGEDHWGVHLVYFLVYGNLAWQMALDEDPATDHRQIAQLSAAALDEYRTYRRDAPGGLPLFNPHVDKLAVLVKKAKP